MLSYEEGDIDLFLSMFFNNAKHNGKVGISTIKREYQHVFNQTYNRKIYVDNLKWRIHKNASKGAGYFEVTLKNSTEKHDEIAHGTIRLTVENINSEILITKIK